MARARKSREPTGKQRTSRAGREPTGAHRAKGEPTGAHRTKGEPTGETKTNRRRAPVRRPEPPKPRRSLRKRLEAARERLGAALGRAKKPLRALGKLAAIALGIAGATSVGHLVEAHVRRSPSFATTEVVVEGNERLDDAATIRAAGLAIGQNVFAVPPEEARERLEGHPWIRGAEVRRRLPGTYEVTIHERRPAALLSLERLYLVGDDAMVFKAVEAGDPVDLPVITGVEQDRFLRERDYRAQLLVEIVGLLHDYRGAGLLRREPIGEVHVERDEGLTLYVGDDAVRVRLGRGPYRDKLAKLRRVLDRLGERRTRPEYVHLDNVRRPDRVTVKLR